MDALTPVLSALELTLTPTQQAQLAAYMVLLAHWNSTFNLTALRDPGEMLSHHLADCLAVLKPLSRGLADYVPANGGKASGEAGEGDEAPIRLLDVGSGGGLPGVLLAIARPDLHVTCVDTVGKKAAFIRQVSAELGLPNLRAEHARVEQLNGRYELITCRAFASLSDFVRLTAQLLEPGGVWMAMKGKHPQDEIEALPREVDVFHVEHIAVPTLDAERCIVWMRRNSGQGA